MWIKALPLPPTWSGLVLSAVCRSRLQALLPPALGMSGIPSQTPAAPLPEASPPHPASRGIHQLWPFRNALTPGTARAGKTANPRAHSSLISGKKSLRRPGRGLAPTCQFGQDGRMDGWMDRWIEGRHQLEGLEDGQDLPKDPTRKLFSPS